MAELRPKHMTQGEFAELLRENGFPACSKAAVSLAERSKETGVEFTPEARNAARGLLNSTRRAENRKHGRKTTVWFDEETRAWLETRAYLEDSNVGEIVRRIVAEARRAANDRPYDGEHCSPLQRANRRALKAIEEAASQWRWDKEKAASDAATSEAAEE